MFKLNQNEFPCFPKDLDYRVLIQNKKVLVIERLLKPQLRTGKDKKSIIRVP